MTSKQGDALNCMSLLNMCLIILAICRKCMWAVEETKHLCRTLIIAITDITANTTYILVDHHNSNVVPVSKVFEGVFNSLD